MTQLKCACFVFAILFALAMPGAEPKPPQMRVLMGITNRNDLAFRLACSEARQRAQVEQDMLKQRQTQAAIANNSRRGRIPLMFPPPKITISDAPSDVFKWQSESGDLVFSFPLLGEFVAQGARVQVVVSDMTGQIRAEKATVAYEK